METPCSVCGGTEWNLYKQCVQCLEWDNDRAMEDAYYRHYEPHCETCAMEEALTGGERPEQCHAKVLE